MKTVASSACNSTTEVLSRETTTVIHFAAKDFKHISNFIIQIINVFYEFIKDTQVKLLFSTQFHGSEE